MALLCWMITLVSWSMTLSLVITEVSSNRIRNVTPCQSHQISQSDNGSVVCIRVPGCGSHAQSTHWTHSLEHIVGVFNNFKIALSDYTELLDNVQTTLREDRLSVAVDNWGLENLYPLSINSGDLTNSLSTDEHRNLREIRWLLTSAAISIQLLQKVNIVRPENSSRLVENIITLSRKFVLLLKEFRVRGLPDQEVCVQSSPERVSHSLRAKFTAMALRDVGSALNQIRGVLDNCTVEQNSNTGHRRFRLRCETSVFLSSLPDIILYQPSWVLSS